jgi:transposase-like protein
MSVRSKITQQLIRKLLDEGNSPTDLARLLDVTRPTIYAWRDGQPAQSANLRRLANLSGVVLPNNSAVIDMLTGKRAAPPEESDDE